MAVPQVLDGLRRPAFTGDARCWPCTVLNGTILWMAVTVVAMAGRLRLAAVLGVVGAGAIWLRGYLVPYTPRIAPRFVSVLPGDPFDHGRGMGSLADVVGVEDGRTAELLDAALDGGRLAPDARRTWHEAAVRYRGLELPYLAARIADRVPAEARAERRWGTDYVILDAPDGQVVCPRPVAVADLAALDALEAAAGPADEGERLAAAGPFRALLESCPLCGDDLEIARSACCGAAPPGTATDDRQLVCETCPARLHVYSES